MSDIGPILAMASFIAFVGVIGWLDDHDVTLSDVDRAIAQLRERWLR